MAETTILLLTFFCVLLLSAVVILYFFGRRQIALRLTEVSSPDLLLSGDISHLIEGRLSERDTRFINHYFSVIRNERNPNSIQNRLIRAGFFSPNASAYYQIIRSVIATFVMILLYMYLSTNYSDASLATILIVTSMAGAFFFMLSNVFLERMGDSKEFEYRRLFPDFMDMLITCVDAGLSIEAAISRVAREMLATHPDFGLHLTIMTLEIRGGRRVRDALSNLGERLHIDEAKSLAVLFRQSEELGTSVTKSLRVYSNEMRQMRIIRAEEKANALPIKMLFPMAISLFPVSLIMVLAPLIIRIAAILQALTRS